MEEPTAAVPPHSFPSASRHIQTAYPEYHQHNQASLVSQLDPTLQSLDPDNAYSSQLSTRLEDSGIGHFLHPGNPFGPRNDQPRFQEIQSHMAPALQQTPTHTFQSGGQFGMLIAPSQMTDRTSSQHDNVERLQQDDIPLQICEQGREKKDGHFANLKMIPNPPDLQAWRERLFHANDVITMSEDEYATILVILQNVR